MPSDPTHRPSGGQFLPPGRSEPLPEPLPHPIGTGTATPLGGGPVPLRVYILLGADNEPLGLVLAPAMGTAQAYGLGRYGSDVHRIEEMEASIPKAEIGIGGGVRILLSSTEAWQGREKYRRFRRGS